MILTVTGEAITVAMMNDIVLMANVTVEILTDISSSHSVYNEFIHRCTVLVVVFLCK